MSRRSTEFVITILSLALGVFIAVGWYYYQESQKVRVELPNASWEPIFFKTIDKTTELGGIKELRKANPGTDETGVRIWRGFGLGNLEGIILDRANDEWRAFHVITNDNAELRPVQIKRLDSPKSGWETFWKNLTEQELLTLRDPSETNCEESGIDGTHYVVEIIQNKVYRTYRFRENGKCPGVAQMEKISDLLGEEFDSGQEECKTSEWLACAKLRKSNRQNSNNNSKK